MSSLAKHVIHRPRPYRYMFIILIAITLSTYGLWLYLQQQNITQIQKLATLKNEVQELKQKITVKDGTIKQLNKDNNYLKIKTSEQQSEIAIQFVTIEQLQHQLENLQQKIITLDKELLFYQSITQGNSAQKLQIRELQLHANALEDDSVSYRLIITQGQKINKPITGKIKLTLSEEIGGIIKSRVLTEHKINLRYVQLLEGKIKITDNTKPLAITVKLKEKGKDALSQTFDWQIISGN